MSWFSAVPVIAACVAIMFVPGLLVTYLFGLRGIAAWAIAPVVPIGVATVGAIIAPALGIRLSLWVLLVPSLAVALVVGLISYLLRRRYPARTPDDRGLTYAILAGLGVALVVGWITAKLSITDADNFAATFDAVFHYHALAYIQDTGNGSALTVGTLGLPGAKAAFYPVAWHDLAAILQLVTGTTIPVVGNVLTVVTTLLIWPLACMLLARQLFGPSKLSIGLTGALSIAFPAFPWTLMGYGTLWPNILGLALVPAGLAALMSIANLAKDDVIGRGRAWLIMPVLMVATLVAHPNALFSMAVLAIPLLALWLFIFVRNQQRVGRLVRGLVIGGALVVGALVFAYVVNKLPMVNAIKATRWPAQQDAAQAFGEAVLNATNRKPAAWLLSIVVLIGIVSCIRQGTRRWLIACHVLSIGLYVLSAGIANEQTSRLTGFWYNDSWRLAAMVPITGVPLAVIGILAVTVAVQNKVGALSRIKLPEFAKSRTGIAGALVVVFIGVTAGFYAQEKVAFVEESYAQLDGGGNQKMITAEKLALMDDAHRIVPPDALIAANPWIGATALWPLEDRKLLIPNLDPLMMPPDQAYLAQHLNFARIDPKACSLIAKLNVQYLMTGVIKLSSPDDPRMPFFRGLREPIDTKGFQLVAQRGANKLFKITACDASRP